MLYQHYKGGLYQVLGEGIHTETNEELTFYIDSETHKLYARPRSMFYSFVKLDDGTIVPRFRALN